VNIAEPFIRRPVMTTLIMVAIMTFGIVSYRALPVSDLPDVDFPTIQVKVDYPGANPDTMANTCAVPLEREFMTIDGLQSINSTSSTGSTTLVLQFYLNKPIESASVDVEAAINRAQPNLPNDLPSNPTYRKVNPSDTPILYMAIRSPSMSLSDLYDYGNTYIGQRLSMIEGISQVLTYGAPYAARIQVDPEMLAAMNVGFDEIQKAIVAGNVDLPLGTLFGPKGEFTIDANGQLMKAQGYQDLAIKTKDGSLVKIMQVGRALNSLKKDKLYMHYTTRTTDEPAIILAIQKQPGANTVRVIENIHELLPSIQKQLPPSLQYNTIFDKAQTIEEGVNDVKLTLIIAFILVVLIIYLTLGKLVNTIIPSLVLPMSIFGTFIVMLFFNYSIDILSLMALTLSIGFLVDDAIVVLENNVRHVQMGEKPFEGTLQGTKEICFTVISTTICLVSAFIPMLFLGGIVGMLFREFAVTIVVAVFISSFISLSLTALLCSRFIPPYVKDAKKTVAEKLADSINSFFLNGYKKFLKITLNHRIITVLVGIGCVVGSVFLYMTLPKDFLPDDDAGFIQGFTEAKDGTSPFYMAKYQKLLSDEILKDPAVTEVVSVGSFTNDCQGMLFIRLKPYKERGPINNVINRISSTLKFPGINAYLSTLPLINLQVGVQSQALYQYSLTSIDTDALYKYGDIMLKHARVMPGLTQVSSDMQINQPKVQIEINRDRASDLHLSAYSIEDLLSLAYSDKKISTIKSTINQYDVIMETLPSYYRNPNSLNKLYVRSDINKLVPFSEVVKVRETVGPLNVNHINSIPSAMIFFNLSNISLSQAVGQLDDLANKILPPHVKGSVQGTADVFKSSFQSLTFLFLVTIFAIYLILGILYESFIHPITVMSALPPTTFGGLLTLYIFNQSLSLYSFIGIIMLIGIVMKNGIIMIDFAIKYKKEGKDAYQAIYDAAIIRFRPILMTSVSAFAGALPIAIGIGGASAQGRKPLGLAVVGGLIISQVLTLFLTPVIYYYMEKFQEFLKKIFIKKPKNEEPKTEGGNS
jgi:hydrophobic/amphiphilic exporter-1 (mainly G- bacteria), HAE1 family